MAFGNLFSWFRRRGVSRVLVGAERSLRDIEKVIGYRFRDPDLLASALRHRSIIIETGDPRSAANERLEFLGDSILGMVVSEQLYSRYPQAREGFMARMKSLAVSGRQLASKARRLELGRYMQISANEVRNGGRSRRSILEDGIEALIGAIYLDGGLRAAQKFISEYITFDLDRRLIREKEGNYKSLLLEYVQGKAKGLPCYRVTGEEGPDHAKVFHVEVLVNDASVGQGAGRSKKQAEQQAAKDAANHFGINT